MSDGWTPIECPADDGTSNCEACEELWCPAGWCVTASTLNRFSNALNIYINIIYLYMYTLGLNAVMMGTGACRLCG